MTSYSLYGTGSIRWVDGTVSTDDEKAEEQFEAVTNCLAAGAARALLDTTRDLAPEDEQDSTEIYAEQWHSADEGWELEAIHPDDRDAFVAFVARFVRENIADIVWLANRLAWQDERSGGERPIWWHEQGMALYQVGQLLGHEGSGSGVSLTDYNRPSDSQSGVKSVVHNGRRYEGLAGRLALWVAQNETSAAHIWENTWIDSTEEPSLLHIGG